MHLREWRGFQKVAYFAAAMMCLLPISSSSQVKPRPSEQPTLVNEAQQEPLRVTIEEVRIPVVAQDQNGRFDPTLSMEDLLIKEDGVVQQVRSLFRIPASVMLVLDTGGELDRVKTVALTRRVATALVSALKPGDEFAVIQSNNKVESLLDWTCNRPQILNVLRTGLLPAKRTVLQRALLKAVAQFRERPVGNRHLVLISDGINSDGQKTDLGAAQHELNAANITVHVISYTMLALMAKGLPVTRPKEKSSVPEEIIMTNPKTKRPGESGPDLLKDVPNMKGGVVVDLERLFRKGKGIHAALIESEKVFSAMAQETGGGLWLPQSADEMADHGVQVARDIDSQYVVTYKPKRPLETAAPGEFRKVDVISRKDGLKVRSRRGYVAR